MNKLLPFLLFFLFVFPAEAAEKPFPFALSPGGDFVLFSVAIALSSSYTMKPSALTVRDINSLDKTEINAFDRSAVHMNEDWASPVADALVIGTMAAPLFFYFDEQVRSGWITYGVMYAESVALTFGLNSAFKVSIRRVRPYVYRTKKSQDGNDRLSFYSGHTAHLFNAALFFATTYTILHPKSRWLPLIWSGAIVLGATVGTMRYLSGDHFPTDSITGAIMGALTGVSIPLLHHHFYHKKIAVMPRAVAGGAMIVLTVQTR